MKKHSRSVCAMESFIYEIRTWDEMPKEIEQISMYNVFVYTQDYYNQHIKNKQK